MFFLKLAEKLGQVRTPLQIVDQMGLSQHPTVKASYQKHDKVKVKILGLVIYRADIESQHGNEQLRNDFRKQVKKHAEQFRRSVSWRSALDVHGPFPPAAEENYTGDM